MDALTRTLPTPSTGPVIGAPGSNVKGNTGTAATGAGRIRPRAPSDADSRAGTSVAVAPSAPNQRRRVGQSANVQVDVARAQQALDYLARVASQLEALKSDLSTRLAGRGAASRQLEARTRQLGDTLDTRRADGGASLDASLHFDNARGAQTQFRIQGLEIDTLQAGGRQTLGFSVGAIGGPQLAATLDGSMTAEEIARRLDRTLAPVHIRAGLDEQRALVFSTPESSYDSVKDAIAVTGRGRVDTVALPAALAPKQWQSGNPDALRQSLREVVQALARVRHSQDAASIALSMALADTGQTALPQAELAMLADDFSATAASHDYQALLAITSALAGVSRDRVQALLGLR